MLAAWLLLPALLLPAEGLGDCAVPRLREAMLRNFDAGRSIEKQAIDAALCRERVPAPAQEELQRAMGINYLQDLDAFLHDLRYADYVQGGRPPGPSPEQWTELIRLARGELAREPRAPLPPGVASHYMAPRRGEDDVDSLRVRMALYRMLEDSPVLRLSRRELADLIQPPMFALAAMEAEQYRRNGGGHVSRVGDVSDNHEPARPVTTELLDWAQVYRILDQKAANKLADVLERRAMEDWPSKHYCYRFFKESLDEVLPGIKDVAPAGDADTWYRHYNRKAEMLGYSKLRRIDPRTVPWLARVSPAELGLRGLILTRDADCPQVKLSDQTAIFGDIEGIVGAGSAPGTFRTCSQACQDRKATDYVKFMALRNGLGNDCIGVYAFVRSADSVGTPKQPVVPSPQGEGYGEERRGRRALERAQEDARWKQGQRAVDSDPSRAFPGR